MLLILFQKHQHKKKKEMAAITNFSNNDMKIFENKLGCYFKLINFTTVKSSESLLRSSNVGVYMVHAFVIFIILNIGANSMLILGIIRTSKKLNAGQKLFIYLSCTDLLAGFVVIPLMLYYQIHGTTCLYMTFMLGARTYIVYADSCILLVIALQRYYTIQDPFGSKRHQHKRLAIMIVLQIALSLLMSFIFIGFYHYADNLHTFRPLGYISNVAHTTLSICILTFVGKSWYSLRKYNRTNSGTFTPEQLKNHRKSVSSLLIIGIMMVLYILVYQPILAYWHLKVKDQNAIFGNNYHDIKQFTDIVMFISLLNTTTNSFVIIGRSNKLMRYFFKSCLYKFWK